jgi:hypothetical protein
LGWLTLGLCAAGAACVLASAIPLWLALPVCLLVFLGGIAQFARLHRYCSAGQVDALVFERGRWLLHLCSGARFPLELAATPLLCEHVMAACFQRPGRRNCAYRVFLLPDMIDMESWRRTALALRQDEPGKSG